MPPTLAFLNYTCTRPPAGEASVRAHLVQRNAPRQADAGAHEQQQQFQQHGRDAQTREAAGNCHAARGGNFGGSGSDQGARKRAAAAAFGTATQANSSAKQLCSNQDAIPQHGAAHGDAPDSEARVGQETEAAGHAHGAAAAAETRQDARAAWHTHVATGTADGDAETSPRVTPARPKRSRDEPAYDETRRRQRTTQSRTAYMERGVIRRGAKRVAVEMGSWAITRVVDGRYEWRDAGLRAVEP